MEFHSYKGWAKKAAVYLGYFVGFFILAALINWYQAPSTKNFAKLEKIELTTLQGKKVSLDTAAGKKTILYFFAPWCAVCKVSMDSLNSFVGGERLQTVAVGLDYDNARELTPFQEKLDVTVYAGSTDLQRRFRVDRYPTVFILNADGSVAHTMVGYTSRLGIWMRTLL